MMKPEAHNKNPISDKQIADYILANWRKQNQRVLALNLRIGDVRLRDVQQSLREQGLLPSIKDMTRERRSGCKHYTNDEIKEFVLANWRDMTVVQIRRALKAGDDRVTKATRELRAEGKLPSSHEMQMIRKGKKADDSAKRIAHMSDEDVIDFVVEWESLKQAAQKLKVTEGYLAKRCRIAQKNLGLNNKNPLSYALRHVKTTPLYKQWVPNSAVNHDCRWLAA